MNDQERITDLILLEKKMSTNYNEFANECVNPQLRQKFLDLLNQDQTIPCTGCRYCVEGRRRRNQSDLSEILRFWRLNLTPSEQKMPRRGFFFQINFCKAFSLGENML